MRGPCRSPCLNDYAAYKFCRRTDQCLSFSGKEQPKALQCPMFTEDEKTGLPRKTYPQGTTNPKEVKEGEPGITKRRTTPTRRRTGEKPTPRYATGITFKPDGSSKQLKKKSTTETTTKSWDDWSSTTSENTEPSSEQIDVKKTPVEVTIKTPETQREYENPHHQNKNNHHCMATIYRSKKLFGEIGFKENSPEFVACVKFLETIKPKEANPKYVVPPTESPRRPERLNIVEGNKKTDETEEEDKFQDN